MYTWSNPHLKYFLEVMVFTHMYVIVIEFDYVNIYLHSMVGK